MNSTFEIDDQFSEQFTELMERVLSAELGGTVVRRGTYTSDFVCTSGVNVGATIEVKFRRRWYGDLLVEIKNTYTDTGTQYPGWFYTQLISDYFVYVIPASGICFMVRCDDLRRVDVDGRETKHSYSTKKGRPHLTDNVAIPFDEVKRLASYKSIPLDFREPSSLNSLHTQYTVLASGEIFPQTNNQQTEKFDKSKKKEGVSMSIDLNKLKKNSAAPARIIVYGPPGIGKTTFPSTAPDPIYILTEDGLASLDVVALPTDDNGRPRRANSFKEVMDSLAALAEQEHQFKTLVIDSLDWLEQLIWGETCKRLGVVSIEDPGYGKGYAEALVEWSQFYAALDYLRDVKGMTICMIAHGSVKAVNDPEHPPYDQNTLKLNKAAAAKAIEYADIVAFASLRSYTTEESTGKGKNDKKTRGISTGERFISTQGAASRIAKNRYSGPNEFPMVWSALAEILPKSNKQPIKGGN